MLVRLASGRHARSQSASNHYEPPTHRPDTLCQARLSPLSRRQHSVSEGSGLLERQAEEHQVLGQIVKGRHWRRRCSERSPQALEAQERPGQAEGRGERLCSPLMNQELKSEATAQFLSTSCDAANVVCSPRENARNSRSSSPDAAQSHFCHASDVQSELNEEIPQFNPSDQPFSFVKFLENFVYNAEAVHVGLGRFFKLSLQPLHSRAVHRAPACPDLWPCPLPTWKWTGSARLSSQRRRGRKRLQLRHSLLQLVVATLNWESLGHLVSPPPQACVGYDLREQREMIERLERLIGHFAQASPISSQSLRRSCQKISTLLRACQELPANQEVNLDEFVFDLVSKLDPYSSKPTSVDQHDTVFSCDPTPNSPSACGPPNWIRILPSPLLWISMIRFLVVIPLQIVLLLVVPQMQVVR